MFKWFLYVWGCILKLRSWEFELIITCYVGAFTKRFLFYYFLKKNVVHFLSEDFVLSVYLQYILNSRVLYCIILDVY